MGMAEKLYTAVVGISMFFSAFIVALVVQWKLALITMSIVPAMLIAVGGCMGVIIPIETKLVSRLCRSLFEYMSNLPFF
jgi:ATP-binding cassette, subfamily B (MDR/TAP), member 1